MAHGLAVATTPARITDDDCYASIDKPARFQLGCIKSCLLCTDRPKQLT